MRLRKGESGSTLIMVIGIVAALAIMASTLVILVVNSQSGTSQDRARVKAFNVAEAALDEGMYQLSARWPQTSGATVFDAAMQDAFRQRFDPQEFPALEPGLGPFVTVKYYDDTPAGGMDTFKNFDSPVNNIMWVVAQAGTGSKVVRIQAKVERTLFDGGIPRGNVIFSGGPMKHDSNNPPGQVDTTPGAAYTEGPMYVKIAGLPEPGKNPVAPGSGIQLNPLYGAAAGSLESVFPEGTKEGFKTLAQSHERYFTGSNAIQDALDSPSDPIWSPEGGISGLTVIEPTVPGTLKLDKVQVNSAAKPGIVLLLKCPAPSTSVSNLDFQGSKDNPGYYGVLYTDGTVDKGSGGYNVHGAIIAAAPTEFQGTVNVLYNDNCIVNLGQLWASNVKIVGNSWRELPPETNP